MARRVIGVSQNFVGYSAVFRYQTKAFEAAWFSVQFMSVGKSWSKKKLGNNRIQFTACIQWRTYNSLFWLGKYYK